jgi:hypothetical protein
MRNLPKANISAFASALQNHEALLRDFGQSQYFPNVGKYCALSPSARKRGTQKEKPPQMRQLVPIIP